MSYLVLARKWRPKRFAELVGQEHVVRALTNALDSGRVHHAFLFTGTRGVGKTTIARIFAKSLNCERGTGADPCGECETCLAIDAGRYIDLLEIDAASNTGVDDVREVIENAQYLPSRGNFKVYLIDEVHMLSKAAFNALLKTLEEPPEHVKFLLATTDPQKLPVTVLSRCLQFNLKRLDEGQISGQITKILGAESIPADEGAIRQIAKAADGSLRDGLSLLDQAIAYAGGKLDDASVAVMLGTVDTSQVGALLDALAAGDGKALLDVVARLADFSPDWGAVLEALAEALHAIQVKQLVPEAENVSDGIDVAAFASKLRAEVVQLWWQMALNGKRDLHLAPSARAGFEMSVLRMLAFRPANAGDAAPASPPASRIDGGEGRSEGTTAAAGPRVGSGTIAPQTVAMHAEQIHAPERSAIESVPQARTIADADDWHALIASSNLRGLSKELAANTSFVAHANGVLELSLSESFAYLRNDKTLADLSAALASALGMMPKLVFVPSDGGKTLHEVNAIARSEKQAAAEESFLRHPAVQALMAQGATLVEGSIRPIDESKTLH